jgi:hypothetical protein
MVSRGGCQGVREGVGVSLKVNSESGFIELKISSALHGERLWRRIATRGHVTRKKSATRLAIWRSACVVCGGPFEIATRFRASSVNDDVGFRLTTCPAHRMASSERMQMYRAKKTDRRAVFEDIRRRKLASSELNP